MASKKRHASVIEAFLIQLDEQENCDVTFTIEGQTIGAHRSFLQARSDVFQDILKKWNPDEGPILIEDVSFEVFKQVLRYIYSDEIKVTNDNVFQLMFMAKNFEMDRLEMCCSKHIKDSLGEENVCAFMNEAVYFKAIELQNLCLEIFSKETEYVCDSDDFLELSQPALSKFLESDKIDVLEIDLFLVVKGWMKEQCEREGITDNGENMRAMLGDALYKIRFPTMSVHDFSNEVAIIDGFLEDTEVAQIFKKITVMDSDDVTCIFSDVFRANLSECTERSEMTKFTKQNVMYHSSKGWCSLPSYVDDWDTASFKTSNKGAVRLVMQCCADLANSQSSYLWFSGSRQTIDFKRELLEWTKLDKSKNFADAMNEFRILKRHGKIFSAWITLLQLQYS